jgi:mannosyl-oligosaccharide alpha-1,2-mannosidase
MRGLPLLACLGLAICTTTFALQAGNLTQTPEAAARADEVRAIFREAYALYKAHAWGRDSVNPISHTASDDRNGWGATIIDSMSTMVVMGLDDLFDEAVTYVGTVDFTRTSDSVSLFETTIRYIGGLLSAYELSDKKHGILLQQATTLADKLMFAWQEVRTRMLS